MKRILLPVISILLIASFAAAQDFPRVEIFGGYSLQRSGLPSEDIWASEADLAELVDIIQDEGVDGSFDTSKFLKKGFQGSVTFNVNKFFGIETSVRYNSGDIISLDMDYSGEGSFNASIKGKLTDFAFLAGPRFACRKNKTITPFAHVLFGLDRAKISASTEISGDADLYDSFINYLDYEYDISLPTSDDDFEEETDTGFGMVLGGGIDLNVSSYMAIRLIQADYFMSKHGDSTMNNVDLSFGAVFFLGK